MPWSVGDKVVYGGIGCVIAYDAGSEQSWGRYILCEEYDLNHYEPDLGTGEPYSGKEWGVVGQDDSGANGTAIGTGKANTDYLIGKYNDATYLWYYVNQHRTNTSKDWCVPSKDELNVLYENNATIGNFSTTGSSSFYCRYWSSSESSSSSSFAWYQIFSDGNQFSSGNKDFTNHRVRCVAYATEADLPPKPQTETIEMTCETEGAEIRYTLDGSEPTVESTLYSDQFEVTPPVTIKARGYKEGLLASDVASYEVEVPPVPVTVPMALPDGSVLFYDRGEQYGNYHIGSNGYPVRNDGAEDDGTATSNNWRYLICDQHDLDSGTLEWGPYGTNEGLTRTAVGYGLPNTNAMLVKYATNTSYWWKLIKQKRDNTGLNWFMPSKDELNVIYENMTVITGQGGDAFKTDTSDMSYWSSSEDGIVYAWGQYFSNGSQGYYNKGGYRHCRLLRRV